VCSQISEFLRRTLNLTEKQSSEYAGPFHKAKCEQGKTLLGYHDYEQEVGALPFLQGHRKGLRSLIRQWRTVNNISNNAGMNPQADVDSRNPE